MAGDWVVITINRNGKGTLTNSETATHFSCHNPHALHGIHSKFIIVFVECWDQQPEYVQVAVKNITCGANSRVIHIDDSGIEELGIK